MTKSITIAFFSVAFALVANSASAQALSASLAMHTDNGTKVTAGSENISKKMEKEKVQAVSIFTENVSSKSMSDELTVWVQQELAQPKQKAKRRR